MRALWAEAGTDSKSMLGPMGIARWLQVLCLCSSFIAALLWCSLAHQHMKDVMWRHELAHVS
jgi:hypothetical protein